MNDTETIIFEGARRIYDTPPTLENRAGGKAVSLREFEESVSAWWKGDVIESERDGCVFLTVKKADVEPNRNRLLNCQNTLSDNASCDGPTALLRATFPPPPNEFLFQVIPGPAFANAQAELKVCEGHNSLICKWPYELAGAEREDYVPKEA